MSNQLASSGKDVIHVLTTSEQIDQVPITSGALLLCTDNGEVYYDYDDTRKRIVAKATEDSLGGFLTTAVTNVSCSNNTITITKSDGTANTFTLADTIYGDMKGASSSAAGASGLVPTPAAGDNAKFLRGDGIWTDPTNTIYSNMTGATATIAGKSGLVPAPAAGKQMSFLRGDGTWQTVATSDTTYSDMEGATETTAGTNGLVPAPEAGDNVKFLRGDGTWQTVSITDYSIMTGATTTTAGKIGLVPAPSAGANVKFLRGDGTWQTPTNTTYSVFTGATSNVTGTSGLVPAPAAGTQFKFLRGDGTWAIPTDTAYNVFTGATASSTGSSGLVPAPAAGYTNRFLCSNGTWSKPTGIYMPGDTIEGYICSCGVIASDRKQIAFEIPGVHIVGDYSYDSIDSDETPADNAYLTLDYLSVIVRSSLGGYAYMNYGIEDQAEYIQLGDTQVCIWDLNGNASADVDGGIDKISLSLNPSGIYVVITFKNELCLDNTGTLIVNNSLVSINSKYQISVS